MQKRWGWRALCALVLAAQVQAGPWEIGKAVPAGPLTSPTVVFGVAAYLPTTGVDGDAVLEKLGKERFHDWTVITRLTAKEPKAGDQPAKWPGAVLVTVPVRARPAPTGDLLKFMGKGLEARSLEALARAQTVCVITLITGNAERARIKAGLELAAAFAAATGAIVLDDASGVLKDAAGYQQDLVATWKGDVPAIGKLMAVHTVADGANVKLDTFGLSRFGLPELVMDGVPQSAAVQASAVLNLMAQELVERPALAQAGELSFHPPMADGTPSKAPLRARLTAVAPEHDAGRAIRVSFAADGAGEGAGLSAAMAALVGPEQGTTRAPDHDPELDAARARAQVRIKALGELFRQGKIPEEAALLVKAGFKTPSGGREWMWVQVTGWKGDTIDGMLANQPNDVPDIGLGSVVHVDGRELFDYLYHVPGKPDEGGETNAILEKRSHSGGQ